MDVELSIVLPCYNEEKAVPRVLEEFSGIKTDYHWELVLVDNGSTDGTGAIIASELARPGHSFAGSVRVDANRGYGFGILAGLKSARGKFLAWSHCDLQTPVADVFRAFERLRASRDPSRTFVKGRRLKRALGQTILTWGMQIIATLILWKPLTDINAQPKVFPRALYDSFRNPPMDFSLDLYAYHLALVKGYAVETVPVVFERRPFGVSKWAFSLFSRWKHIKSAAIYMIKLRFGGA
jgi:glycosyltransferase involved in cell wall biosynthesis